MIQVFFGNHLWSVLLLPQRQSQMSFLLYFSTIFSGNILLNLAKNIVELNVRDRIICNRLWKQPADWQVLCLRDWNSFSCFVIFFIKSFAPNAQCWCKSQKAGWASRFKNVHWSNFAKPRRGRPRSIKLFEPRAAKGPKSWRGRPWSGKLFGLAVCQEPRSGLNVPSRLLIHPIIPNAFRLKWSFSLPTWPWQIKEN